SRAGARAVHLQRRVGRADRRAAYPSARSRADDHRGSRRQRDGGGHQPDADRHAVRLRREPRSSRRSRPADQPEPADALARSPQHAAPEAGVMQPDFRRSIRWQLTRLMMATAILALLLTSALLIGYEFFTARRALARDLERTADMVGVTT